MSDRQCERSTSLLERYLTEGTDIPEETLAHLKSCAVCSEIVARASELSDLLARAAEPAALPAAPVPATAVEVTSSLRRRRMLRIVAAIVVSVTAIACWYFTVRAHVHHPRAVWTILMVLFNGPIVLGFMTAGVGDTAQSRVYKRLAGRELSGVCRGLSEWTSIPVWIVRMAFVSLIFFRGTGLVIYLLLDLLLPIHPDDRASLLRFRIARWWRQRTA